MSGSNSPTISRRQFGAEAAGLAGAIVVRPACLAAETQRSAISFVVVSDTHLGYGDKEDAQRQWAKTAAEIQAAEGAFVLHLGDVVDGGREAQYPKYLAIRRAIEKPVHEIPGNHDPAELFAKHLRTPIDFAFEHDWLRVALLGNAHTDSHDGFLEDAQLAWLEGECRAATEKRQFVLIAMHVPAHVNAHPDRGWHVKPEHGQTKFYELLDRHKDRILAVFHGHFHNGLRGWNDRAPLHEVVFPSALYNQDRNLEAQQAPGYNLPEFRPGFTQVRIAAGAIHLQYKPLGESATREKVCPAPQLE